MKRKTYVKKMRALMTDLYMDENSLINKELINFCYKGLRTCRVVNYENAYKRICDEFKIT